jgi:protein-S-isoprenylcysteine O-methyltransferase Ste14
MRKVYAAGGTALFFAAAPGVVAGVVPWALTGWRLAGGVPGAVRGVGAVTALAAGLLLVDSFVRFVVEGAGTPAPPAATERLVVGGLYRYVRNPMYLAVLVAILGQAVLFGQAILVLYAGGVAIAVVSFVRWYEEPALQRRFGPAYDSFRAAVPAWRPRLTPAAWEAENRSST